MNSDLRKPRDRYVQDTPEKPEPRTIYWRAVHRAVQEVTGLALTKSQAIGITKRLRGEIEMGPLPRTGR